MTCKERRVIYHAIKVLNNLDRDNISKDDEIAIDDCINDLFNLLREEK